MIIGNNNITNFLEKSLEADKITHAYIFNGPKSIGKRTTAEWFISKLLKTEKIHTHPDFLEVKAETDIIKKEDIDKVIEKARLSSFIGGYKVILVHNAHQMNMASANAFLKTLEEPTKKTVIILLTSEIGSMLPTIISRSSVINFKPIANNLIVDFLKKEHGEDNALVYAKLSHGRLGIAVKIAKQGLNKSEELQEFYKLFFGEERYRIKLAKAILKDKTKNKEVLKEKVDLWLEFLRDIFFIKYGLIDNVTHTYALDATKKISEQRSAQNFANIGKRLLKMKSLLKNNINPSLMLENLII